MPSMDDQRTDRESGHPSVNTWMFEVYTETNPAFEQLLIDEVNRRSGVLDCREDEGKGFVILTMEFTDLKAARNAVEASLSMGDVYIEGPVPYS